MTEAIAHRTVEWEEGLVLALHWLSRTARYTDSARTKLNKEWDDKHKHCHHVLIGTCGSSLLLRYCQEIRDRVDSFEARPDEHRLIAEAALAGDTELAVRHLMTLYRRTLELIRVYFGTNPLPTANRPAL